MDPKKSKSIIQNFDLETEGCFLDLLRLTLQYRVAFVEMHFVPDRNNLHIGREGPIRTFFGMNKEVAHQHCHFQLFHCEPMILKKVFCRHVVFDRK